MRAVVTFLLDNCKFDGAIQLEPSALTRPLRGLIHSRPHAGGTRAKARVDVQSRSSIRSRDVKSASAVRFS